MGIITISRELAALGDETAREVARVSGFRLVDKKVLEKRMCACGGESEVFRLYDERKPPFFSNMSGARDMYLHYLKTAILEEAAAGSCVFIGRGAAAVLKGLAGVLPVFLLSPRAVRVERVRGYFQCDEKKACAIICHSDSERAGFHRYFFDVEWRDTANYRLALNTAAVSPALAARLIDGARALLFDELSEAACADGLRDLALAQRVIHHIVYERALPVQFLDVVVKDGAACLYGAAQAVTVTAAAEQAAGEVPGVVSASSEIQVVQDFSVFH
ncbi:MAG: cytidylate kinase family protein [Spirochaetaceae bacterium]|jgi:cytidylate kinase|nr:cytidylate kinase family protein [Spirochaetaceae bacterium]